MINVLSSTLLDQLKYLYLITPLLVVQVKVSGFSTYHFLVVCMTSSCQRVSGWRTSHRVRPSHSTKCRGSHHDSGRGRGTAEGCTGTHSPHLTHLSKGALRGNLCCSSISRNTMSYTLNYWLAIDRLVLIFNCALNKSTKTTVIGIVQFSNGIIYCLTTTMAACM